MDLIASTFCVNSKLNKTSMYGTISNPSVSVGNKAYANIKITDEQDRLLADINFPSAKHLHEFINNLNEFAEHMTLVDSSTVGASDANTN